MTVLPTKMLPNRFDREPYLGNSATGPKWAEKLTNRPCRFVNRRVTVTSASGDERRATGMIHVRPADKPTTGDRIHIDGEQYEVLEVTPITGAFRIAGYEAVLG